MVLKVKNLVFRPSKKALITAKILGVGLVGTGLVEVLSEICRRLEKKIKTFIVTPNPEFLVFASRHEWFRQILNSADIAIPDGVGLVWLGGLAERIAGVDLANKLLERAQEKKWHIGLVGARRGEVKDRRMLVQQLQQKYPGALFVNFEDADNWQQKEWDIIFACQGMGSQEKWLVENRERLRAKILMGVGGGLDFLAGITPRAPKWVQRLGLEWLYRLFQEPWRARRQLALLEFIWLVIKERLRA